MEERVAEAEWMMDGAVTQHDARRGCTKGRKKAPPFPLFFQERVEHEKGVY